jgi:hypothetical protein
MTACVVLQRQSCRARKCRPLGRSRLLVALVHFPRTSVKPIIFLKYISFGFWTYWMSSLPFFHIVSVLMEITNCLEHIPSWEATNCRVHKGPPLDPHPKLNESSPQLPTVFILRFILILSSHQRVGLPCRPFLSGLKPKFCKHLSFLPCLNMLYGQELLFSGPIPKLVGGLLLAGSPWLLIQCICSHLWRSFPPSKSPALYMVGFCECGNEPPRYRVHKSPLLDPIIHAILDF